MCLCLGRGGAIIGHDRIGEFLVVGSVVRFVTTQRFDLRDGFTPEHPRLPRDAKLTRPIDVRHPTVERADKLAQGGNDAVHCGHTTLWLITHPVG